MKQFKQGILIGCIFLFPSFVCMYAQGGGGASSSFAYIQAQEVGSLPFPFAYNDVQEVRKPSPWIALKTNLLFDLALAPNIEVEVPAGARWSVNAEWMFPWWLSKNRRYCFQLLSGGVEGRCWLGNRKARPRLTGHFLGLYAGGGKYDFQWREKGYQGEFYIASGLSYGYSASLSRHFNLEFSLGLGVLRTNYRHYRARDNYQSLLWQNNGQYTWVGPTKTKISLVWLIGGTKKRGGGK